MAAARAWLGVGLSVVAAGAVAAHPPSAITRLGRLDAYEALRSERPGAVASPRGGRALVGTWDRRFVLPGLQEVHDAAEWNGTLALATTSKVYEWLEEGAWEELFSLSRVRTLLAFEGGLVAAGSHGSQNIYFYDGSARLPMGDGLRGDPGDISTVVHEVVLHDGTLYAAGSIEGSGDRDLGPVAWWDGKAWQDAGVGLTGRVFTIESHGGALYVGGDITISDADGRETGRWVARRAGDRWVPVGRDFVGRVRTLESDGVSLWGGGVLVGVGPVPLPGVARLEESRWISIGHFDDEVRRIRHLSDGLWVGGRFGAGSGGPAENLTVWDGTRWSSPAGGGITHGAIVNLILEWGEDVVIGGAFDFAGPVLALNLAIRRGGEWGSFVQGMDGTVHRVRRVDGELIVAGDFLRGGGVPLGRIAAWRDGAWTAFGEGFDQRVYDVAGFQGDLIAAGRFERSGLTDLSHIARWDGAAWQPLGSGTDDFVYALAVLDGDLYAAGSFSTAGGVAANGIAAWNGTEWQAVDGGFGGGTPFGPSVYELRTDGDQLVAAGSFSTAGDVDAANIARLTAGSWEPIGEGLPGWVLSVTRWNGALAAGGAFEGHVRAWAGGSWTSIAEGLPVAVLDLQATGGAAGQGELVACHTTYSSTTSAHILEDAVWSPVLFSRNRAVRSSLPGEDGIWFGGDFTSAAGVPSARIARFEPDPPDLRIRVARAAEAEPAPPRWTVRSNPFTRILQVSVPEGSSQLELFDVGGRRLAHRELRGPAPALEIDTRAYPAGVYFLRLTTGRGSATRKVVKVR